MTLKRLSGAKSLRDPLVSKFLGEWGTSSPLPKAWWYEATEVGQLSSLRKASRGSGATFIRPLRGARMHRVTCMSPSAASGVYRIS